LAAMWSITSMRSSGDGFAIKCACCSREFASRGLRCCSADCERRYTEQARNLATMAEVRLAVRRD
jgi:hypothetical protein